MAASSTGSASGTPSGDRLPRPARVVPVALSELARLGATVVGGSDGAEAVSVTGITASSAQVRPGDLFAGVPGRSGHGARFAAGARAAGAVAVLTDADGLEHLGADAGPVLVVDDVRGALGPMAATVYAHPSRRLRVLGITGTSGKTTTTFLIRDALRAAGVRTGLIGTVATLIDDDAVKSAFTTPEAPELHALLAVMAERGVTAVAMEVSSHALAMGRVGGVEFSVAGFTNLSQDHLDFHPTIEDYFEAKALLFDGRAGSALVCVDDDWGRRLAERARPAPHTVSTDGGPADWQALDVVVDDSGGSSFRAVGPGVDVRAGCSVPGGYNVQNALLALAVCTGEGLDPRAAAHAIAGATVPGRMERIDAGQPFLAVVDYSHKPAAVDGALRALRPLTRARLITVLGCGGDRDAAKRPMMGRIAAAGSDLLIVTDDNPRSEAPELIRGEMLAGALDLPPEQRGQVLEIGDRREAIAAAVAEAGPGDTVLVAGKGHETGQEIQGVVHPFDDREVLRSAIERQAAR